VKKILSILLITFGFISYTNANEFMEYEDFLFDAPDILGQIVKVQVPVYDVDIPTRTINVDFDNLAINVKKIARDKIKDIIKLCDIDTTCFIDVEGKLINHPDGFPTYLIDATSASLHFLVGVAVSESGFAYVGTSANHAAEALLESAYGDEEYLYDEMYVGSPGKLVIAYGSGLTEFYVSWAFDKNEEKASNEALKECNEHYKCSPIVFDIPWW
jgi:hypothetical protein